MVVVHNFNGEKTHEDDLSLFHIFPNGFIFFIYNKELTYISVLGAFLVRKKGGKFENIKKRVGYTHILYMSLISSQIHTERNQWIGTTIYIAHTL